MKYTHLLASVRNLGRLQEAVARMFV